MIHLREEIEIIIMPNRKFQDPFRLYSLYSHSQKQAKRYRVKGKAQLEADLKIK